MIYKNVFHHQIHHDATIPATIGSLGGSGILGGPALAAAPNLRSLGGMGPQQDSQGAGFRRSCGHATERCVGAAISGQSLFLWLSSLPECGGFSAAARLAAGGSNRTEHGFQ